MSLTTDNILSYYIPNDNPELPFKYEKSIAYTFNACSSTNMLKFLYQLYTSCVWNLTNYSSLGDNEVIDSTDRLPMLSCIKSLCMKQILNQPYSSIEPIIRKTISSVIIKEVKNNQWNTTNHLKHNFDILKRQVSYIQAIYNNNSNQIVQDLKLLENKINDLINKMDNDKINEVLNDIFTLSDLDLEPLKAKTSILSPPEQLINFNESSPVAAINTPKTPSTGNIFTLSQEQEQIYSEIKGLVELIINNSIQLLTTTKPINCSTDDEIKKKLDELDDEYIILLELGTIIKNNFKLTPFEKRMKRRGKVFSESSSYYKARQRANQMKEKGEIIPEHQLLKQQDEILNITAGLRIYLKLDSFSYSTIDDFIDFTDFKYYIDNVDIYKNLVSSLHSGRSNLLNIFMSSEDNDNPEVSLINSFIDLYTNEHMDELVIDDNAFFEFIVDYNYIYKLSKMIIQEFHGMRLLDFLTIDNLAAINLYIITHSLYTLYNINDESLVIKLIASETGYNNIPSIHNMNNWKYIHDEAVKFITFKDIPKSADFNVEFMIYIDIYPSNYPLSNNKLEVFKYWCSMFSSYISHMLTDGKQVISKVLVSESNVKGSVARNILIQESTSCVQVFHDDDDRGRAFNGIINILNDYYQEHDLLNKNIHRGLPYIATISKNRHLMGPWSYILFRPVWIANNYAFSPYFMCGEDAELLNLIQSVDLRFKNVLPNPQNDIPKYTDSTPESHRKYSTEYIYLVASNRYEGQDDKLVEMWKDTWLTDAIEGKQTVEHNTTYPRPDFHLDTIHLCHVYTNSSNSDDSWQMTNKQFHSVARTNRKMRNIPPNFNIDSFNSNIKDKWYELHGGSRLLIHFVNILIMLSFIVVVIVVFIVIINRSSNSNSSKQLMTDDKNKQNYNEINY